MPEDSPEIFKEFQLKEKLYLDAIDFLDKGKVKKNMLTLNFLTIGSRPRFVHTHSKPRALHSICVQQKM